MFGLYSDSQIKELAKRIDRRYQVAIMKSYAEGLRLGWLIARLDEEKGDAFKQWAEQQDQHPTINERIEWFKTHLNAEQCVSFEKYDAVVEKLLKKEQSNIAADTIKDQDDQSENDEQQVTMADIKEYIGKAIVEHPIIATCILLIVLSIFACMMPTIQNTYYNPSWEQS